MVQVNTTKDSETASQKLRLRNNIYTIQKLEIQDSETTSPKLSIQDSETLLARFRN